MSEIQEIVEQTKSGIKLLRKLMPVYEEIKFITLQAEVLFEDASENLRILKKVMNKSEKKRSVVTRNAVRSTSACIEGFAFVLKSALNRTIHMVEEGTYSNKQVKYLQSEYTNESGADNFKVAMKCFASKYNVDVTQLFGSKEFETLRGLFELRNNLMHPKKAQDLEVDRADMILLSNSLIWFLTSVQEVFSLALEQIEQDVEKLNNI
ncbi:hypothetical protein ACSTEF_21555 [Vibrio vulnificus]|uniref:hypothetical protein n=1 Tax=Vibrio vulnificus TaxID=672 RepID=UPI003EDA4F54